MRLTSFLPLTTTASRLENYPELKARLEKHAEETRQQAKLVKSCIDRLGGGTSALKDIAGKVTATAQGLSGMFVSDEVVKAGMASYRRGAPNVWPPSRRPDAVFVGAESRCEDSAI